MQITSKGKNQQYVKERNRALILKLICTKQCLSRIDIAGKTGLTKMTVTNIINDLISAGLLKEGAPSDSLTVGRKPIQLLICEDGAFSVGVYISRDYIKTSLISLDAKIIKENEVAIDINETAESLLCKILNRIEDIIAGVDKEKIFGIGVAVIGPLNIEKGILLDPTDFHNIKNLKLKEFIESKTGFYVTVNNDMNAAALAELLYGKGRGKTNFVYLGITNGIGSGIITNGYLYIGEEGFGGEIGHTTINFNGPVCNCGNKGCLEAYISIPIIIKKAREYIDAGQVTLLKDIPNFTFKDIALCAENNDLFCTTLMNSTSNYIALALINAINILDSDSIYIGHDGALGGELLTKKIEQIINKKIFFKYSKYVKVDTSAFGDLSPVIGSGVLILDELFSGKLLF